MIELSRFCMSSQMGTFGLLKLPSGETLYTVERPWLHNQPFISCVPCETYDLVPFSSPRFGDTYALRGETVGVTQDEGKARYACLFHSANQANEVQGCIAPGHHLGATGVSWAVFQSKAAIIKLLNVLAANPDERQLRIVWADPWGGD